MAREMVGSSSKQKTSSGSGSGSSSKSKKQQGAASDVHQLGRELLSSTRHINNLVPLIKILSPAAAAAATPAAAAGSDPSDSRSSPPSHHALLYLHAFFCTSLKAGRVFKPKPAATNRGGAVEEEEGEKEKAFGAWLRARYGDYCQAMLNLIGSDAVQLDLQRLVVDHLMEVARLERRGHFNRTLLTLMLQAMVASLSDEVFDSLLQKLALNYFAYADVRVLLLSTVRKLCMHLIHSSQTALPASANGNKKRKAALLSQQHRLQPLLSLEPSLLSSRLLSLLLLLPPPPAPPPTAAAAAAKPGSSKGSSQDDKNGLATWTLPVESSPNSGVDWSGGKGVAESSKSSTKEDNEVKKKKKKSSSLPWDWSSEEEEEEVDEKGRVQTKKKKTKGQMGDSNGENESRDAKWSPQMERKMLTSSWLTFLRLPLSAAAYKQVLTSVDSHLIPHMTNPLLLSDFFTSAYSVGGVVAVMSLTAIFNLITQHGFEYPRFYQQLYCLLEPSIFMAKYRARFFELLDRCLASPLLPSYLAAAFCKRLSRLSLSAPPHGSIVCIALLHNLLRRHPAIAPLVHRLLPAELQKGETAAAAPAAAASSSKAGADPFAAEEEDPSLCHALESSLWEVSALKQHYCPAVARFVVSLETDLSERKKTMEVNIGDFSQASYSTIFNEEASRRLKTVPLAAYRTVPSSLFEKGRSATDDHVHVNSININELGWTFSH